MESKGISNVNLKSRVKQIVVLALIIMVGVLISQAVQAQGQNKFTFRHGRHVKIKQTRVMKADKACHLLNQKRHAMSRNLMASNRKPKFKPMAEMDAPAKK